MKREETRSIKVGNLTIGGNNDVIIQSMTNTKTHDVEATVKQIQDLTAAGCQLVRLAVLDQRDALAIKDIKNRVNVPLVADIHFDYRLALQAIKSGIDKIRINPGNIGSIDKVKQVVTACKEHHIPIRIGVNGGSLEKDILAKYGKPTAEGMIESAKKHVEILESLDFHDICIYSNSAYSINHLHAAERPKPCHMLSENHCRLRFSQPIQWASKMLPASSETTIIFLPVRWSCRHDCTDRAVCRILDKT